MRKSGIVTAVALLLVFPGIGSAGSPELSSQSFYIGPGGVRVSPDDHSRYRSYRRHGSEEVRHGRWRSENVADARMCARLRRACIYKEERGETGEGNCRRYRRLCR